MLVANPSASAATYTLPTGALIDAAVKATGIQGAKAAVILFEKLEAAAKASQTVETSND